MSITKPQPSNGSLNAQEILFIVFRHKWKIILLTLLGFGGAAGVYLSQESTYKSEAKLQVHYVVERLPFNPVEGEMPSSVNHGTAVMDAEKHLLQSQDLALDVAKVYGPERIVPDSTARDLIPVAAGRVQAGLEVDIKKGSKVMVVSFQHADPEVARGVLRELVRSYFDRHLEIRRSFGAFALVTEKRDLMRAQLRSTQDELNQLKNKARVIDLQASIQSLGDHLAKTRNSLLDGEADLAEQQARINALEDALGQLGPNADDLEKERARREAAARLPQPGLEDVARYEALKRKLQGLHAERIDLLSKFTPENPAVEVHEEQIRRVDRERLALINEFPGLGSSLVAERGGSGLPDLGLVNERINLTAVAARTEQLRKQLETLEKEHMELASMSTGIEELERRKRIEEEMYTNLELSLEKARADEALDPSKIPNISIVEQPTFARKFQSDMATKLMLGLAASGIMAGLGLAFLIELLLDRTVKRPQELEARLHIPLMLAIPFVKRRDRTPRLALDEGEARGRLGLNGDGGGDGDGALADIPHAIVADQGTHGAHGAGHFILPYANAIRDRITYHFEINGLSHKPKLVALTGLSEGAGTSTVAAGLAKAFSQSGTAKVLLVDLNSTAEPANGSGAPGASCSLDSALRAGRELTYSKPDDSLFLARVSPNAEGGGEKPFAPKHLYDLMPELRSSEFDYIIFDMPPIGPTSPTVAMAGIMDEVLLVLDAENTDRDTLKKEYADLRKGKAHVSCVFNKRRQRNPRWLEGAV